VPPLVLAGLRPRAILRACYAAMLVQAVAVNLTPLLFLTLQAQFGLTFEQVGRLVLVNFGTQLLVDLGCAGFVDRVSARALAALGNALAAVGLVVFALAPFQLADPYLGLMLGTVVFSVGCGLLEVIVSPIVERTPGERKAAGMAFLHAFYPIGKVLVTVVTGLLFFAFGTERWNALVLAWSVLPAATALAFVGLRLPPMFEVGRRVRVRDLLRNRTTWVALLSIALAGASEVSLAQWASAFAERGLGVDKLTADLLGLGSFSVGMAVGRLWFGLRGSAASLLLLMRVGALGAVVTSLVMALAGIAWLSLAATALGRSLREPLVARRGVAEQCTLPARRGVALRAVGGRWARRGWPHAMARGCRRRSVPAPSRDPPERPHSGTARVALGRGVGGSAGAGALRRPGTVATLERAVAIDCAGDCRRTLHRGPCRLLQRVPRRVLQRVAEPRAGRRCFAYGVACAGPVRTTLAACARRHGCWLSILEARHPIMPPGIGCGARKGAAAWRT